MLSSEMSPEQEIENLKFLEAQFVKARQELVDQFEHSIALILQSEPTRCTRCTRFMVTRKIWDEIPKKDRPLNLFAPVGSHGLCHPCYCTGVRKPDSSRKNPLSESEVARLRRKVGLG